MSKGRSEVVCAFCRAEFFKKNSQISKSKSGLFFCSIEHRSLASRADVGILRTGSTSSRSSPPKSMVFCRQCGIDFNRSKRNSIVCSGYCKQVLRDTISSKDCVNCSKHKEIIEFPRAKSCIDGYSNKCKVCTAAYMLEWKTRNTTEKLENNAVSNTIWAYSPKGESTRFKAKLRKYGLTEPEFEDYLSEYGILCRICRKTEYQVFDHDHATDVFRGLLCSPCNLALGGFKDCTSSLSNAIHYLEDSRKPSSSTG